MVASKLAIANQIDLGRFSPPEPYMVCGRGKRGKYAS